VLNLDAQIALQHPVMEQESADIAAAEANLQFAQQEQARYDGLMKTGSGTLQRAQQSDAALREKIAQLQHGKSGLLAAQRKVDVLTSERPRPWPNWIAPRRRTTDGLNLSYTTITAPVDGTVGARSLRVGQFVQAGTQLMALVRSMRSMWWRISRKPAHPCARRSAGRDPDRHVSRHKTQGPCRQPVAGKRSRIRAAAADNATGNFTKIVQRVPVKIVLDDHSLTGLLRPACRGADRRYQGNSARRARHRKRLASELALARPNAAESGKPRHHQPCRAMHCRLRRWSRFSPNASRL